MYRVIGFVYGANCYTAFLLVFLYLIAFLSGGLAPKGVDSGPSNSYLLGFAVDFALILLFGMQHSIMSRPWFKRVWTKIVPKPLERSTYVLASSVSLGLLMWAWQPIPLSIWSLEGIWTPMLWSLAAFGWGLVLASTFAINHFHLFGLQQVFEFLKKIQPRSPAYKESWMYKLVRHPLMLGFIIAFWATPDMSLGRLIFAGGMTFYILMALQFEERDLLAEHGQTYANYRDRVPMLVPFTKHQHRSPEVSR
ncbi:MAG: methanethiol S-methyltransferase [Pseudomonadota bacterium]